MTACCTIPTLHTQIHPTPVPMDPTAGELVPIVRKPHRAYPPCHVRDFVPSRRDLAPKGEPYPWCDQRGRWTWNEQHLCDEHKAMFEQGIPLHGIYPDGRWCRRSYGGEVSCEGQTP